MFTFDETVHQPIGFDHDAEFEVVVGRRHRFKVIGAIDVRRAVEAGTVIAQRLGHVGMIRGALENHVLQQMGHAGFAIAFMTGADQHGQVDRDRRSRGLGEQQNPSAVRQPVFGDALDGSHLPRAIVGFCSRHTQ